MSGEAAANKDRSRLNDTIAELKVAFIHRLNKQVGHLVDLADRFEKDPDSHSTLKELSSEMHRITGIAASLGFPELGSRAEACDVEISRILEAQPVVTDFEPAYDAIDRCLSEIEQVVSGFTAQSDTL